MTPIHKGSESFPSALGGRRPRSPQRLVNDSVAPGVEQGSGEAGDGGGFRIPKHWMVSAIVVLALASAFFILRARWAWEKDRVVELCVDGGELSALAGQDPRVLSGALAALKKSGVASLGLYWDGRGNPEDSLKGWTPLLASGMSVVLRPLPEPFTSVPSSVALKPAAGAPLISAYLGAGPAVWGYPDGIALSRLIAATPWTLPWVEFSRQKGLASLAKTFPERLVRAHGMDEDEMALSTPGQSVARFRRAARERGVRFLYLRFFPGLSLEQNISYIDHLAVSLRRAGLTLGRAAPRLRAGPPIPGEKAIPARARQALALVLACFLPAFFFLSVVSLRRPAWFSVPLLSVANLSAALLIAAVLSAPVFFLGLETFRGVKAALMVPLFFCCWRLYRSSDWRGWLSRPLTWGGAAFLAAGSGVLAVYVLRSGHGGLAVSGAELKAREWLEVFFGVRPRFKEFAFGYPCLWLGFFISARPWPTSGGNSFAAWAGRLLFSDPRPWLLAGFISQLSVVNTFCHTHMPLAVCLLRVFHGFWLGALGGSVLIGLCELWRRRAA